MILARIILAFALIGQLGAAYRCCEMAELCRVGKCGGEARVSCCTPKNESATASCCPTPANLDRTSCECCKGSTPGSRQPVEGIPPSTEEITITLHLLALPGVVVYDMPRGVEPSRELILRPPRAAPTSRRLAVTCVWRE